jgi:hypothetical protein
MDAQVEGIEEENPIFASKILALDLLEFAIYKRFGCKAGRRLSD